jgi:hypothetical protein
MTGKVNIVFPIAGLAGSGTIPPGNVTVGSPVTLQVMFDPNAYSKVGFLNNPGEQVYSGPVTFLLKAGSISEHGSTNAVINIADNGRWLGQNPPFDYFQMSFGSVASLFDFGTPSSSGTVDFTLTDSTATAFNSFAIPPKLAAPHFSTMSINLDSVGYPVSGPPLGVIAQVGVDSLGDRLAVPEPAAWVMIVIGFGALGAALRNRRNPHSRRSKSGLTETDSGRTRPA